MVEPGVDVERLFFFILQMLFGCTVKHNLINCVYKNTDESITKSWFYNGTQSVWDATELRGGRQVSIVADGTSLLLDNM